MALWTIRHADGKRFWSDGAWTDEPNTFDIWEEDEKPAMAVPPDGEWVACEDKACDHQPDLTTMTLADVEQTPAEVIYDVDCWHCGRSGAFRLTAKEVSVDW